jgi:hypothetical protein
VKDQASPHKPVWRQPDFIIIPILLAFLLLGFLIVTHYGKTWDEIYSYSYAMKSLNAYSSGLSHLPDEKGPFYNMIGIVGSNLLSGFILSWAPIDSWHFMSFVSFLIGIYCFFRLCRRLIDPVPAAAATLLFFTQPVIWGHAFTNPKDIPFLTFFLGSMTFGLEMVDHFHAQVKIPETISPYIDQASANWEKAPRNLVRGLKALGWTWIGLLTLYPITQVGISWGVHQIYSSSPDSGLGRLFTSIAQNAGQIPVQNYIHKAQTINTWVFLVLILAASLAFGLVARQMWMNGTGRDRIERSSLWDSISAGWRNLWHGVVSLPEEFSVRWRLNIIQDWKASPRFFRILLAGTILLLAVCAVLFNTSYHLSLIPSIDQAAIHMIWFAEIGLSLGIIAIGGRVFPSSIGRLLKTTIQPHLLLASCFLGFACDIRTLGPASGGLVAAYFLIRSKLKSLPILLVYGAIGGVVAYLFWPFLWESPLQNYFSSFTTASSFFWRGLVLFKGIVYPNRDLPISYLPTLFGLQFTEAALGLIGVGVLIALFLFWKRSSLRPDLLVLATWFAAPVAAAIALHSTVYNNFRQLLFIFPPVFVIAGLAFQLLWSWLKRLDRKLAFAMIALLAVLPGIAWNIDLHPYEYVYYNGLIGNVEGAYRNFDTDYWNASYKEEIEYLNVIAPPHSNVMVYGSEDIAGTYARSDLNILPYPLPDDFSGPIHYAVLMTSSDQDLPIYPNSPVIHQVIRNHAVLSLIKQVQPSDATAK